MVGDRRLAPTDRGHQIAGAGAWVRTADQQAQQAQVDAAVTSYSALFGAEPTKRNRLTEVGMLTDTELGTTCC